MNSLRLASFPDSRARALYERALGDQWHIERDVNWEELALEQVAPAIRHSMSFVYSYVFYAESYGLGTCGRLVDVTAEGWVRQLAAVQVMDEARHVEFFSRVLAKLGGLQTVPKGLVTLHACSAELRTELELFLHGQVVEAAAQALFVETAKRSRETMAATVRLPGSSALLSLIDHIVRLVGRDEARHIALGTRCLSALLERTSAAQRSALEARVVMWCGLFNDSFAELSPHIQRLGVSPPELLDRMWSVQRHQFKGMGIEIGDAPSSQSIHSP